MRFISIILMAVTLLFSHNLEHHISYEKAITISLKFASEGDFSFEQYEVYAPNQTVPFQVGRTDLHARVSFIPDIKGEWKVKLFSQDGHGKIILVDVNKTIQQEKNVEKSENRIYRVLGGLLLLLGIFGLIYFIARRKNEKNSSL